MNRLVRLAILAFALFITVSCQNEERATSPDKSFTPIAFRFQTAKGTTLPQAHVIAIKVWADDSVLLINQRYDWESGEADLQVPLHRPLRFELRGIRRRDNRDLLLWTATGTDTLDDLSAEVPLVTMSPILVDTSAPDILAATTSDGALLVVLDTASGKLSLSLPAGSSSGTISIPDSLADSLYVHGVADTAVDGNWTLRFDRTDTATIVLVSGNGAVATWKLSATTRDLSPIILDIGIDNGGTSTVHGDTILFTLPYVVDSTIHLAVSLKDSADRPESIAFDEQELSAIGSQWTKTLPVPAAGSGKGAIHRVVTKDSVGNTGNTFVLVERSTSVRVPELAWSTPPGAESLGVHEAKFILRVIGGDSLNAPVFASRGLSTASTGQAPLHRSSDTVWWGGTVSLLAIDSGAIVASVNNRLGTIWRLDTAWITRFDPRGADTKAPTLVAGNRTVWTRTGSSSVLAGRAWDERGGKVFVVVSHSGRIDTATWSKTDSAWSWTLAWNGDGDTTASVIAFDSAGNASTAITIRVVRDSKTPDLAWGKSLPVVGDTLVTGSLSMAISVTASDDGHLRAVYAFAGSSSDTLSLGSLGGIEWARTIAFRSGWNVWTFGAIDSAGNRTEKVLRVLAGDTTGIAMTVSVNNGASQHPSGDTLVFTLPYVVDSALSATVAIATSSDRPSSLKWGSQTIDIGTASSWSIPLPVPAAGTSGATSFAVSAKDSLGNASQVIVRIVRDTNASAPTISWATPPADKPWGAVVDSFVLLIVGGDSLHPPVFQSEAFGSALSASSRLRSKGDSTWWTGSASLANKDSGAISAKVENLLGRSWISSAGFVHRYDPAGPDVTPPTFTFDALPANGWTSSSSVSLRGKAFDARSSKTTVLVKGASGRIDTSTWSATDSSWSMIINLATDVDTTISVYAVDTAANATTPVAIRIRRDRSKPGFEWAAPPTVTRDTLRTNAVETSLRVSTIAPDLNRFWAVRVGSSDTLVLRKDSLGSWSAGASLPQGWTTWIIRASDSAGNDSQRVLHVLRDTIAPTISWSVSGSIAEGKYAVSAKRDTIWLSSDTTITLALTSTTGFSGVAVPAPSADSASVTKSAASTLALRQATGSSTTWTFRVTDELGNPSIPVPLVVVGMAPVAPPVAKAGSSAIALASGAVLPWPKTVHYSCPDAGTALQGVKADTLIHKTVSMSPTCKLGRLRSSLRTFAWSIADTASLPVPRKPVDSSKLAVAVDASGNLWMMTADNTATPNSTSAFLYRSSLSPDSGLWNNHGSKAYNAPMTVLTARGTDGSGKRYHVVTDTAMGRRTISWVATNASASTDQSPVDGSPELWGVNVQGSSIHFRVSNQGGLGRFNIASATAIDTLTPNALMKGLRHCATQSSLAMLFYGAGTRPPLGLWSMSGRTGTRNFEFPLSSSGYDFASTPKSESFFVVGQNSSSGALFAYKFASTTATSPSYFSADLPAASLAGGRVAATWEGDDLWLAPSGSTLYRTASDLSSSEAIELPGIILGQPEPDPTGGVWVLVQVGSGYRVYHVRGSPQG